MSENVAAFMLNRLHAWGVDRIYGYPGEKQSLSTPCQVSCASLSPAIEFDLLNPSGLTAYDFCGLSTFSDLVVTNCMLCYGLTDNEKILANCMNQTPHFPKATIA